MSSSYLVGETGQGTAEMQVEFEPVPQASVVPPAEAFRITFQGETVGEAVMVKCGSDKTPPPDMYLTKLLIDAPYRGRGLGTAALLRAADIAHDSGVGLCTDPIGEYAGVRRLWQKLAEQGIARMEELAEPAKNQGYGTTIVLNHDRLRIPGPAETVTSTD